MAPRDLVVEADRGARSRPQVKQFTAGRDPRLDGGLAVPHQPRVAEHPGPGQRGEVPADPVIPGASVGQPGDHPDPAVTQLGQAPVTARAPEKCAAEIDTVPGGTLVRGSTTNGNCGRTVAGAVRGRRRGTVGWTTNTAANGLVDNGANVTMYGLAVEHYQAVQVQWNDMVTVSLGGTGTIQHIVDGSGATVNSATRWPA
jgi:hypothetical protein